jgi:AraC-like DNA-binding protein
MAAPNRRNNNKGLPVSAGPLPDLHMAHELTSNDSPRMADWTLLRPTLHWAYEGRPIRRQGTFKTPCLKAWLVEHGALSCTAAGRRIDVRAGTWVFLSPGVLDQAFSDDAAIVSLDFDVTWPDGSSLFRFAPPLVATSQQATALDEASRQLVALAATLPADPERDPWHLSLRRCDATTYFQLAGAFRLWLSHYASIVRSLGGSQTTYLETRDDLAHAVRSLDRWPCDRPLQLDDVAAGSGLTPSRLRRLFRVRFGHSPREHVERRREELARRVLETPGVQVKQVGYAVGFSEPQHFSRWFRRRTGELPSDFRRTQS